MNFAHIGNLVFQRADDESVPAFRVREGVAELGGGVVGWGAPEGIELIEPAADAAMNEGDCCDLRGHA